MTKQETLLKKYLKTLRLSDWDVKLKVMTDEEYQTVHGKDFAFDTNGCTEIGHDCTATIFLKDSLTNEDMRKTLLHECIHLVTHPYDSFVRETLIYVDSRKIAKKFKNDAMWQMEINVSKITTIIDRLLQGE